MNHALKPFFPVSDSVAKLFYPHVEVVLHDLESEKLVYISNAFSKRRAGDPMLNDVQDVRKLKKDVVGPYEKVNVDGKRLKSVSTVLRDSEDNPVGIMCINFNTESFSQVFESLKHFLRLPESSEKPEVLFSQDWKEHTGKIIDLYLSEKNVALSGLSMKEKSELVLYLEKEGVFAIRNVIPHLCNVLGVSRATIYKWLKEK